MSAANQKALSPVEKVDRYVELRESVNEHRKLGDEIKTLLVASGKEIRTPKGNLARMRAGAAAGTAWRWVAEKLRAVLTPKKFRELCPPAPNDGALQVAAVGQPELLRCREEVAVPAGADRLEVTAA